MSRVKESLTGRQLYRAMEADITRRRELPMQGTDTQGERRLDIELRWLNNHRRRVHARIGQAIAQGLPSITTTR